MCAHVCASYESQRLASVCFSVASPSPLFWGKVSHWMQNSLTWLDKMANWLHAYFSSPVLGLQTYSWHFVWLPDIQTQVFFALLTEPSPNKHPFYMSSVRDSMSRNCPCPTCPWTCGFQGYIGNLITKKHDKARPKELQSSFPDKETCLERMKIEVKDTRSEGKAKEFACCYDYDPWSHFGAASQKSNDPPDLLFSRLLCVLPVYVCVYIFMWMDMHAWAAVHVHMCVYMWWLEGVIPWVPSTFCLRWGLSLAWNFTK